MGSQDDAYMDDYDYYQNTGELAEYFEEDNDEYEEVIEDNAEYQTIEKTTMSNIKLKYLNEITEVHDAAATKFGVELKSFVFRSINDSLTLYMEFVSIADRRHKGDLTITTVLYDKDGDLFDTQTEFIEASYFKGFEVVKFEFDDITPSDIGRIVIY